VGVPKVVETIEDVLREVERILCDRERGMKMGKIVIKRG